MMTTVSAFAALLLASVACAQDICVIEGDVIKASVNFFEGQLGYFQFEGCNGVNPTLGLERNKRYTFVQSDPSNWFHPMGFAYGPDGALDDQDELEPGISKSTNSTDCASDFTCPSPQYQLDGVELGGGEEDPENFGLDNYEPQFFLPLLDWQAAGEFSISLEFTDDDFEEDFFYFCHIHQFMSGRIKLVDGDGSPLNEVDTPALGYTYDAPSSFDQGCGTFGLDSFQLPNALCPDQFVCNVEESADEALQEFAGCIDAMNCAMMSGMTTSVSTSPTALFIYQMIPHHENAVNMAKALLHSTDVECEDLANEDDPACVMNVVVREIINTQNFQIQTMRNVLKALDQPATDNCEVPLRTPTSTFLPTTGGEASAGSDDGGDNSGAAATLSKRWVAGLLVLMAATYE